MAEAMLGEIASFGEWVQRQRRALALTREGLARRVGCSPVTIKKIERDERRPSHQIAELLADHLLISEPERQRFVRMARGELVPAMISPPADEGPFLPAFLRARARPVREQGFPFVAREEELARLQAHLAQALDGSGQVVFITGEAGCGKSILAQEFARRSQEAHPDLIMAGGHCNAYTGIGDPYLPFREILGMLTGDIESQTIAGQLHPEHARRLWQVMPMTLQALLDSGRDLFDIFVPTQALLNRITTYIQEGARGLAPLQNLAANLASRNSNVAVHTGEQQSALFEQYTRVMQALARRAPLLLILDDLQWADAGSINLLFHLGRRLTGKRILVVGVYRPADVALGRDGARHPLEPVVNELQRHFGNAPVVVSQAAGRQFVEALVDSQPNRLDAGFREALYWQTGGHALFTVEMLRGLQERGELVQDADGQWVEGATLNWTALPARVEGMIKERLARLPLQLQESLKVASVEGELFTAEVVAQVQGMSERQLIGQLSSVLDRQQDLIRVQGIRRVDGSGQTISQYRFRHILFQRFLYEGLDLVERVYLHRAVGQAIEQLYGDHAESVALPLARHFAVAGDDARALRYFTIAGDTAAAMYANAEAITHYTQAVEIAKRGEVASETMIHLYTRLGRALELSSLFDRALALYEELNGLACRRGDRTMELVALTCQITLYTTLTPVHNPVHGQALLEQALRLAREVGDQAAEAKILWNLATLHLYAGRARQAIVPGEQSLALARALNRREQMAFTLNDLVLCYASICDLNQAKAAVQEAGDLWRELGNLPMLADSLSNACFVCIFAGEYEQAIAFSQEAFDISREAGSLWGQSYSRHIVGLAYWERGLPDQAIAVMEESIRLSELAGFAVPQAFTRADLALVYGSLGALEQSLETAHLALSVAETQVPLFQNYVLTRLAQLHLWYGRVAEAEAALRAVNRKPSGEWIPLFFLEVVLANGELALQQGDFGRALTILDTGLRDIRRFGVRSHLAKALYLQAQAMLALGQRETAQEYLQQAVVEATALGARFSLWPPLLSLSQLAPDATEAEHLRSQARGIVEAIAAHTPTPELRASFLNLPQVRALFAPIAGT
ncbi:MAG TPA: AAA family ATPase [Caldilineaceae bacterium]|nr:AAA family ATPase [Caldilineaceae bacterium]